MLKVRLQRGPSVRACVKRLNSITLGELKKLSTRDLNNILKVGALFSVINNQLTERNMIKQKPVFTQEFTNAA